MKGCFALVLLALVGAVKARNSVNGTTEEWTLWFLSNLSVVPAMTASIKYNIRYPKGGPQPILTFYYNGQNSPNLQQRCNAEMHGQLYNQNLAIPLNGDQCDEDDCTEKCRYYRRCRTTCTTWSCEGSIQIQDFEPKSYFFSLGFDCGRRYKSLNGLHYNVTIYDESNKTSCVDLKMAQGQRIDRCEKSYQFAAIPNQLGAITLNGAISRMNTYLGLRPSELPSKECLEKWKSFLCEIFLPRCLPEENRIILPCREDCQFYLEGCLNFGRGAFVNCDYLPPCEGKNTVTGAIEEDTTWFLSNLSVRPAMMASIEYHIQYQCWDCLGNERHQNLPILTFYYMGQDSPNLQRRCNAEMHGQLFNKDLAVPLRGRYREKFWCNDKIGGIRDCYGKTTIQDFEPKSYFFSLGVECNRTKNLKGLKYDVTIYDESNRTSCVDLNKVDAKRIDRCDRSYQYAAIPNQVGDTDLDAAVSPMNRFLDVLDVAGRTQFVPKILKTVYKDCLKKLKLFLRQIILPQCLPKENKILLPCRDTCKYLLDNCILWDDFRFYADADCDYLPPCPSNGGVSVIIGLSVGACVIVVVMAVCVKYRKRIRNYCSAWYSNRNMTTR